MRRRSFLIIALVPQIGRADSSFAGAAGIQGEADVGEEGGAAAEAGHARGGADDFLAAAQLAKVLEAQDGVFGKDIAPGAPAAGVDVGAVAAQQGGEVGFDSDIICSGIGDGVVRHKAVC